jgi:hypothetical protein
VLGVAFLTSNFFFFLLSIYAFFWFRFTTVCAASHTFQGTSVPAAYTSCAPATTITTTTNRLRLCITCKVPIPSALRSRACDACRLSARRPQPRKRTALRALQEKERQRRRRRRRELSCESEEGVEKVRSFFFCSVVWRVC